MHQIIKAVNISRLKSEKIAAESRQKVQISGSLYSRLGLKVNNTHLPLSNSAMMLHYIAQLMNTDILI